MLDVLNISSSVVDSDTFYFHTKERYIIMFCLIVPVNKKRERSPDLSDVD